MLPELSEFPVGDAVCSSLETMAFICSMPPEPGAPIDCPPDLRRVTIAFDGPVSGTLDIYAPKMMGQLLAANLLACGVDDPEAVANADDVLKELANVTCGALINAIEAADGGFELSIPRLDPQTPADWDVLVAGGKPNLFDADGHLIAVLVR